MRRGLILLIMLVALGITAIKPRRTAVARRYCPACQKVYNDCLAHGGSEQYCELLALDCQDNICPR